MEFWQALSIGYMYVKKDAIRTGSDDSVNNRYLSDQGVLITTAAIIQDFTSAITMTNMRELSALPTPQG